MNIEKIQNYSPVFNANRIRLPYEKTMKIINNDTAKNIEKVKKFYNGLMLERIVQRLCEKGEEIAKSLYLKV